jgi:hypothetical protein
VCPDFNTISLLWPFLASFVTSCFVNKFGLKRAYFIGNISGATRLLGATVQPRHNHGGGRVFSKIYQGRWEGYFET